MDQITRRVKGTKKTFEIYTTEETADRGLKAVHWTLANPGDWAITDDGWVAQCLSRASYQGPKRKRDAGTLVTLTIGRQWVKEGNKLLYGPRKFTRNYSHISMSSWGEEQAKRQRVKRVVQVYVAMVLAKKIDWSILGNLYRPESRIPEASVKRLFKQEEIKKMVDVELEKQLKDRGMGTEWVLDVIKEAYEVAKKKLDPSNMLRAAENLIEIHGMVGKSTKDVPSGEYSLSPQLEEAIFKATAELPSHDAVIIEGQEDDEEEG